MPTSTHKRIAVSLRRNPSSPLGKLSRELHVSRRTIQNAVHSVTGKTFRDLRGEILLARIKNLLVSAPNSTIRKLSLKAGYRSPRAFARAVRRTCGVSPRQLRTRIAKELLASEVRRRFRNSLRATNTRAIQNNQTAPFLRDQPQRLVFFTAYSQQSHFSTID